MFVREAVAVGMKAIETGIARVTMSREELERRARTAIGRARGETKLLMKEGYIRNPPE